MTLLLTCTRTQRWEASYANWRPKNRRQCYVSAAVQKENVKIPLYCVVNEYHAIIFTSVRSLLKYSRNMDGLISYKSVLMLYTNFIKCKNFYFWSKPFSLNACKSYKNHYFKQRDIVKLCSVYNIKLFLHLFLNREPVLINVKE